MADTLQARMSQGALALLDALDDERRAQVQYPTIDGEERELAFYTPTDHGGLRMQYMTSPQQREVLKFILTGLSPRGFVTTNMIMSMENILDMTEGFTWGLRDGMRIRDPLAYAISIFGDPAGDKPWGWRFGGHHVSLNYLVTKEGVRSLPSFFGSDRATTPATGINLMRPLAAEEDLGRTLIHLFSPEQRERVIISAIAPPDIVTSNRGKVSEGDRPQTFNQVWRSGLSMNPNPANFQNLIDWLGFEETHYAETEYTAKPKGLSFLEMSFAQQNATRALLQQYIDRMTDDIARAEIARLEASITTLHFAWAGGLQPGEPHYYRIQGDSVLVEYDNTQSRANHIHSVWRDPKTDFGRDILAAHYAEAHTGTAAPAR